MSKYTYLAREGLKSAKSYLHVLMKTELTVTVSFFLSTPPILNHCAYENYESPGNIRDATQNGRLFFRKTGL